MCLYVITKWRSYSWKWFTQNIKELVRLKALTDGKGDIKIHTGNRKSWGVYKQSLGEN